MGQKRRTFATASPCHGRTTRSSNSLERGRARGPLRREIFEITRTAMAPLYGGWPAFQHVLPFDVCRAIEEQMGGGEPSIWTEERDRLLWAELHG